MTPTKAAMTYRAQRRDFEPDGSWALKVPILSLEGAFYVPHAPQPRTVSEGRNLNILTFVYIALQHLSNRIAGSVRI